MTAERVNGCANGCDAPVCPPSKVLCAKCLAEIDHKMRDLLARKDRADV